jgi:EAL domain-containing protein (putative c-di-GMP-specific phosphodiesterase class I)/ActR/RegA family two-component response regulator
MRIRSLLVVDDDPQIRSLVVRVGELLGCQVRTAARADEIWEAREDEPDLLLLDLNLPETDGLEVLRELAARSAHMAIHLLSGSDPRVVRSAHRLGQELGLRMLEPLHKPIDLAALRGAIDRAGADAKAPPHAGGAPGTRSPLPTADQLHLAFARHEIFTVFQPILDLATLEPRGAEVLVRWRHPELGLVPPVSFVPLAERSGLVAQLTEQVLAHGLLFAALPEISAGPAPLTLSVNLAPAALGERDLPQQIAKLLDASGIAPGRLVIEVTESVAMADRANLLEVLGRLRLRGVELSIDDFGTGTSSLERLDQLPCTELKIERAFVADILRRPEAEAIVRSTLDLARRLGLRVVAEGIEDPAVLRWLREAGCALGQGFLFSPGLEREAFLRWLSEWPPRRDALLAAVAS